MRTKNFLGAATLALALVAFVSPASALEKRAGLAVEDDRAWEAGGSVTISYYNICTGWVWIWSGWSPNDVVGVLTRVVQEQQKTIERLLERMEQLNAELGRLPFPAIEREFDDALLHRYREGELDGDDAERIEQLLLISPQARAVLAEGATPTDESLLKALEETGQLDTMTLRAPA